MRKPRRARCTRAAAGGATLCARASVMVSRCWRRGEKLSSAQADNQSRLLRSRNEVASGAPFSLTECADANMRARGRTRYGYENLFPLPLGAELGVGAFPLSPWEWG